MSIARVLLPIHLAKLLDYKIPSSMSIKKGQWVRVPFRHGSKVGLVWDIAESSTYLGELACIEALLEVPPLNAATLYFIEKVSFYNIIPKGDVLKWVSGTPKAFDESYTPRFTPSDFMPSHTISADFHLNEEQQEASHIIQQAYESRKHHTLLLDGVTGSGKTEVLFELLQRILENHEQGLVLIPEIALTTSWVKRFEKHFGMAPWIWHSHITSAKKTAMWREIIHGSPCIVIGARSALFLPFQKLRGIIVDEEHDTSFKQEERGFYHARDMAVLRGFSEKCPVVLSSATPSLESMEHACRGKYTHIKLTKRFFNVPLPSVQLVDMKKELPKNIALGLSITLQENIRSVLNNHEQAFIFLNRRGYELVMNCTSCHESVQCPACSFYLVFHQDTRTLSCHYCGFHTPFTTQCPTCQENALKPYGLGVEKLAQTLKTYFPTARIALLSTDTLQKTQDIQAMLESIQKKDIDILVGTQVMAKGHHFPHLTLVGIIDADAGKTPYDIRSGEKLFQLLHQVAGRAGREHKPGRVIVQTHQPQSPMIQALSKNDRDGFYDYERDIRRQAHLPPFSRLSSVLVASFQKDQAETAMNHIATYLKKHLDGIEGLTLLGPVVAPKEKLKARFRYRLLIQSPRHKDIFTFFNNHFHTLENFCRGNTQLFIDGDAQGFM
jgi:primosomal protein N' (replication factor Y)